MTTATTLPRLLTADEVAAATSLPKATVYQGGREGWLPCVRVGRSMRFAEPAVLAWIERGGCTAKDEAL